MGLGLGLTGTGSRGGAHGASFDLVKKPIRARDPIEPIDKGSGWGVKYNKKPGSVAGPRLGQSGGFAFGGKSNYGSISHFRFLRYGRG